MTDIAALLVAVPASLIFLALLIRFAVRIDLVDHPVGRKDHGQPVPVVGGIAIWIGLSAGLLAAGSLTPSTSGLILIGAALVIMGAADDRLDLSWRWRILTQAGAAVLMAVLADIELQRLGYGEAPLSLQLGVFALPVTVFSVVGLINAINMVDGVDGLAGTLVLSSLLAMLALYPGGADDLRLTLTVASAVVVVFLAFNLRLPGRPRALTFMGNSGSALLGLLLAWAAIRLTHDTKPVVTPALAPWLVALPIVDCLVLIVRRLREGRSPFAADRCHFHHLLLDRGWSVTQVVVTAAILHIALAVTGLVLHAVGVPDLGLIGLFIVVIAIYYALTGVLRSSRRHEQLVPMVSIVQRDSSGLR